LSDDHTIVARPTVPAAPLPPADIVLYASDVASSGLHGTWRAIADGSSPNGMKLVSADNGAPSSDPLGTPVNYVDVAFDAVAAIPYTLWMRVQAAGDSKYNDSLWVQFSGALIDGAPAYGIGSTSALLVNLAGDAAGAGLAGWGWVNGGYWLDQRATVTFATSGPHTMRVQVREDGVAFDQIVLSRGRRAARRRRARPRAGSAGTAGQRPHARAEALAAAGVPDSGLHPVNRGQWTWNAKAAKPANQRRRAISCCLCLPPWFFAYIEQVLRFCHRDTETQRWERSPTRRGGRRVLLGVLCVSVATVTGQVRPLQKVRTTHM
jgi:hypothetical protein